VDTWSWDFDNDGTEDSTEQNPLYTYNTPGVYTVALTASGDGGSDTNTKTDYMTVYTPAAADFSATPLSGPAALAVTFTDLSTGDVDTWSWDFDNDGTEDSTEQNPLYTYNSPGTYSVALTASGDGGSDTNTKIDYITVYTPAAADFSGTPTSGIGSLAVTFTDLSTGDVDTWSWDFDHQYQDGLYHRLHTGSSGFFCHAAQRAGCFSGHVYGFIHRRCGYLVLGF
jgi:PKD repeat protein